MVTIIRGHRIGDEKHIFYAQNGETLEVTEFKDGVVTLEPSWGTTLDTFAKAVAGCFRVRSNFKSELAKVFGEPKDATLQDVLFTTIKFSFNGVQVFVNRLNANQKQICAQYRKKMKEIAERERLEEEAYKKTPEYIAKRAKELKIHIRRENVEKDVLAVSETEQLEFKSEKAAKEWEEWVKINSNDDYSLGVVTYAKRWAKYMQHLMRKHNKAVKDIAEQTRIICDIDGVTGFMYSHAVGALAQFWKYGDELRQWHNKQWRCEDCEDVVNISVITEHPDVEHVADLTLFKGEEQEDNQ